MFVNVVSFLFFQTLTSDLRRGPGSRIEWAEGQHTFSFAAFRLFFCLYFSYFLRSDLSKNNVRVRGSSCTKQKYEYHQSVEDIFFGILGILRGRFGLSWIVLILGKGF